MKNSTYHKIYIIYVKLVMVTMVYISVGWVFDFSNIDWFLASSSKKFQTTFETWYLFFLWTML